MIARLKMVNGIGEVLGTICGHPGDVIARQRGSKYAAHGKICQRGEENGLTPRKSRHTGMNDKCESSDGGELWNETKPP